ncbi:MAG: hypothetical protein ACPIOQ_13205, partial [Promethearchaeia archaeon]
RGITAVWTNAQASELDYMLSEPGNEKEREEFDRAIDYLSDLVHWFENKKQRQKLEQQRRDDFNRVLNSVLNKRGE